MYNFIICYHSKVTLYIIHGKKVLTTYIHTCEIVKFEMDAAGIHSKIRRDGGRRGNTGRCVTCGRWRYGACSGPCPIPKCGVKVV